MKRDTTIATGLTGVTGLIVALTGAWWATAGPVLPPPQALPDEVQSMAHLHQVRVWVYPLENLPPESELNHRQVREVLEERLKERDFEVTAKEDVPELKVKLLFKYDPSQPEALSISLLIGLHQPAHIKRLDRHLKVPTATVFDATLTTRDQVDKSLRQLVQKGADLLTVAVRLATTGPEPEQATNDSSD